MTTSNQSDIQAVVQLLKSLDAQSLLLLQAGAQMLKARADMEREISAQETA